MDPRQRRAGTMPAPARRARAVAPVTFLFSDIEGSTRLLERLGDEYVDVLERHRAILRASVEQRGGAVVDAQGDSVFAAFPRPADAVLAAFDAQRALATNEWPASTT